MSKTPQSVSKPMPRLPTQDDLPCEAESHQIKIFPLPTQDDLPYEDDEPMETGRHKAQMELLIHSLKPWLEKRKGGYVNGNMFVYFSAKQLKGEDFRGPDVFVVLGVSNQERKSWVVWEEGVAPDVVIELLSDKTKKADKIEKKLIYQNQLRVPEYFWFDPFNAEDWAGFSLQDGIYQAMVPETQDRLLSQRLGLALVRWYGVHDDIKATWLRWATLEGELLPTPQERAQIAEQKALESEAEIARLKALLAQKNKGEL